ncbi:hypothetical protein BASA81_006708 [Batrachochytrium salamandrivorans]|nr:hypothetical protein BASA81_006708 [Batrachochytrium salamandrivorans]
MKLAVVGFASCPYLQRAAQAVAKAAKAGVMEEPVLKIFDTKAEFHHWLDTDKQHPRDKEPERSHRTSPFVYDFKTNRFVGGHDDTMALLAKL